MASASSAAGCWPPVSLTSRSASVRAAAPLRTLWILFRRQHVGHQEEYFQIVRIQLQGRLQLGHGFGVAS